MRWLAFTHAGTRLLRAGPWIAFGIAFMVNAYGFWFAYRRRDVPGMLSSGMLLAYLIAATIMLHAYRKLSELRSRHLGHILASYVRSHADAMETPHDQALTHLIADGAHQLSDSRIRNAPRQPPDQLPPFMRAPNQKM